VNINDVLPAFCNSDVFMEPMFMQDTAISNASADSTIDESRTRRTIIFSPKICDNVDLLVGNIIHIFPP